MKPETAGGGSQLGSRQSRQSRQSPGSPGSSAPKKDARCLDISATVQQDLIDGLTDGTGATLRGFQAVRSKDFEQVFFVAAELEGPGLDGDDQIGVWATNIIDTYGCRYLSISAIAKEFSNFPDGDTTDANVTMNDDGANLATECTKAVLKGA